MKGRVSSTAPLTAAPRDCDEVAWQDVDNPIYGCATGGEKRLRPPAAAAARDIQPGGGHC
jgi:hypothetical protein